MIKIVYLRHFMAACETGSFSAAATKLNISPTSIRNSVEKLESGLNVTLFVRKPADGVSLTHDGQKLLAQSREFLGNADDIVSSYIAKGRTLRGNLTIGCQEGLSWSLIPRALSKLNEAHSELTVSVKTVFMESEFKSLEKAEVDVLITFSLLKEFPKKFNVTELCLPQACVMMRKGHPLDNGSPVKLKNLARYPHIFIQDGPAWSFFHGMYEELNLEPKVLMYSNISTGAQSVIGRTDAVSLRILRPANPFTPLGDPMVVPVIEDEVNRPRLIAATDTIRPSTSLDKRLELIKICQSLFTSGEMKTHVYY